MKIAVDRIGEEDMGMKEQDVGRGLLIRNSREQGLEERVIMEAVLNYVLAGEVMSRVFTVMLSNMLNRLVGRDTTSHAIAWGLYELLIDPEILERLVSSLIRLPPRT